LFSIGLSRVLFDTSLTSLNVSTRTYSLVTVDGPTSSFPVTVHGSDAGNRFSVAHNFGNLALLGGAGEDRFDVADNLGSLTLDGAGGTNYYDVHLDEHGYFAQSTFTAT